MRIITLLFTVFIDSLGFGLIFPVFSPLIVGNEGGFFAIESSMAVRGLVFGLLVSTYSLGLFFGGPMLGALSDRKGRKKILVGSLWLALLGYLLASFGLLFQNLTLLFLGRLLSGVAASNYGVVQSVVADTASPNEKSKNFGLVGMAWGTGFIIGPYVGGKLAALGYIIPFLGAAFLCLINLGLLMWRLKETLPARAAAPFNPWVGLVQVKRAFQPGPLRGLFLVMFIFTLGWGFFTEFSAVFLMNRLKFELPQIANFYAWVGLWVAVCQGLLIRPLLKRFSSQTLLMSSLFAMGLFLPLLLFVKEGAGVFWILPLISYAESFVTPTSSTLVSNASSSEEQGEMLGISNSIQSAAIGFSPLFSGSLVALYPHLPVTVGSICMVVAGLVFLVSLVRKKIFLSEENIE